MQNKIYFSLQRNKSEGKPDVDKPIIGEEVSPLNPNDSAKYFKLNYVETRTDQELFQFTPGQYIKNGYLKIAKDGAISLLDTQRNPYVSSTKFYWDNEAETLCSKTKWKMADKQNRSITCAKLTFFATAVTAAAVSAYLLSTGSIEFKYNP